MFRRIRTFSAVAGAALILAACATDDEPEQGASETDTNETEQDADVEVEDAPSADDASEDDETGGDAPAASGESLGLQQGPTDRGVEDVVDLLAQHDLYHSRLDLAETLDAPFEAQLLMYREPEVEGELITQVPQTGLESPFRILVWDDDGQTRVAANDPEALADRYGLSTDDVADLEALGAELQGSMFKAVGVEVEGAEDTEDAGDAGDGLGYSMTEVTTSTDDFSTTLGRVRSAINDEGLKIVTEVDHTSNLSDAEIEIDQMTLVIVADAETSSQLLELRPTIGIDLPQRILVYEAEVDGTQVTQVAFHHRLFYETRHELGDADDAAGPLEDLQASLDAIAEAAISGDSEESDASEDAQDSDSAGTGVDEDEDESEEGDDVQDSGDDEEAENEDDEDES